MVVDFIFCPPAREYWWDSPTLCSYSVIYQEYVMEGKRFSGFFEDVVSAGQGRESR
jgi:hypothetical protein